MMTVRSSLVLLAPAIAALLFATACETSPPVQEMSDARQAIAVAREAGAEAHAAEELMQAEQYLESAQQRLSAEEFAEARRAAIQAKSFAVSARELSETKQPDRERDR